MKFLKISLDFLMGKQTKHQIVLVEEIVMDKKAQENQNTPNKKTLWVKILVPILIVVAIGAIWIVKSSSENAVLDESGVTEESMAPSQTVPEESELPDDLKDADFSLALIETADFEKLAGYGIPAIIDYGADSCIPCKEMAPVLNSMNKEMYGKAFVKFADVWKFPEATNNVPVQIIPTQILVNADGTPFVPSDELASKIEFITYADKETEKHVFTAHQGGLTEEQMRKILKEMGVE